MIDVQIQEGLRTRFNPDGSLLRQHQLRMLDMLKFIDDVCKRNGINYWLDSGTLIGAIRHGGFIPWDDDADIGMLREDYEKFVKAIAKENNPQYILQTHKTDYYYFNPYAKLRDLHSFMKEENTNVDLKYKYRGVFIDVFIFEPSSSRFISRIASISHNKLLLHSLSNIKMTIVKSCYYYIVYNLLYRLIFPILKRIVKIGAKDRLRHTLGAGFVKSRTFNDIFPLQTTMFENMKLSVPGNYDNYLKKIYGNYMELPNMELLATHTTELILR